MQKGTQVEVTFKDGRKERGRVAYVRYAPPDFDNLEAVSVVLDSRRHRPGYNGTIFPASSVVEVFDWFGLAKEICGPVRNCKGE